MHPHRIRPECTQGANDVDSSKYATGSGTAASLQPIGAWPDGHDDVGKHGPVQPGLGTDQVDGYVDNGVKYQEEEGV